MPGSTLYPAIPRAGNLSRSILKELTGWIRDEVDVLVARDGPNILRPDDALTLHEIFIALRQAENISVSDLRATGIHKAVQDIAGLATRWPGRLCDDCDEIISAWTKKFGPLHHLHPFLYGRGGRLEGIATVSDHSREALLKRWAEHCPDKIHPKKSHRLGDLGFKAGMWWINPLFAHHAGIIGLESCEGGTTYDKHGAYALLLKDNGEIEASNEDCFTYRVPQNDKGKFRLTAATPKSRGPIRVLRSHSINSVWGPKAGVRYEGLYRVKGWSIKQTKSSDTVGGLWRLGDIIFDVRFEREDPTPMMEVIKRPTTTEVDDYTEYKRLRKLSREDKRNASRTRDVQSMTKAVPSIPLQIPATVTRNPPKDEATQAVEPTRVHFAPGTEIDLSAAVSEPNHSLISPRSDTASAIQTSLITRTLYQDKVEKQRADTHSVTPPCSPHSTAPSTTASAQSYRLPDIREVAPWTEADASLTFSSLIEPSSEIQESVTASEVELRNSHTRASTTHGTADRDSCETTSGVSTRPRRKISSETKGFHSFWNPIGSRRDIRKSIFVASRSPLGKLLDGMEEINEEPKDGRRLTRTKSPTPNSTLSGSFYPKRASSTDGIMRIPTPRSVRSFSVDDPINMVRRNEICEPNPDMASFYKKPSLEARIIEANGSFSLAEVSSSTHSSLPFALKDLISPRRAVRPRAIPIPPPNLSLPVGLKDVVSNRRAVLSGSMASLEGEMDHRGRHRTQYSNQESAAVSHLRRIMEDSTGATIRVVFTDPFIEPRAARENVPAVSPDVPPEAVE